MIIQKCFIFFLEGIACSEGKTHTGSRFIDETSSPRSPQVSLASNILSLGGLAIWRPQRPHLTATRET